MFVIWCLNVLVLLFAVEAVNGYRINKRSSPAPKPSANANDEIAQVQKSLQMLLQTGNMGALQNSIERLRTAYRQKEAERPKKETNKIFKVLQDYEHLANPELKEEREKKNNAEMGIIGDSNKRRRTLYDEEKNKKLKVLQQENKKIETPEMKAEREQRERAQAEQQLEQLKAMLESFYKQNNRDMVFKISNLARSMFLDDETKTDQEKIKIQNLVSGYEKKVETPEVNAEYEKVMKQKDEAVQANKLIKEHMENEGQPTSEDTSVKKQLNDAVDALTELRHQCHAETLKEDCLTQSNVLQSLLIYLEYPVARLGKDEARKLIEEAKKLEASGESNKAFDKLNEALETINEAVENLHTYIDKNSDPNNPTYNQAIQDLASAEDAKEEIDAELEAFNARQSSVKVEKKLMEEANILFKAGDFQKAKKKINEALKAMNTHYKRANSALNKLKMERLSMPESEQEEGISKEQEKIWEIDREIKAAVDFSNTISEKLRTKNSEK